MALDSRQKIGLALLSGAAALGVGVLAYRKREEIAEAVEEAAYTVIETARDAVDTAKQIAGGGIAADVIENFRRHNLAALIDKYRGPIPWATVAATIEKESRGNPYAYNYYSGKTLRRSSWTPGTELPANSHANGLLQILRKFLQGTGSGDYKATLAEAFDAEANIRAVMPVLQRGFSRIPAGLPDALRDALTYYAHNQGGGTMDAALKFTAGDLVEMARAAGKSVSNAAVAVKVAARVPLWQAVEPALKGVGGQIGRDLGALALEWAPAAVLGPDGTLLGYTGYRSRIG